jgi:hypothetical protein
MNFTIDPASISIDDLMKNIRFLEKKQNIIMQGDFTKIMYSVDILTMNGMYVLCPLQCMDTSTKRTANHSINKHMIWYQPTIPSNNHLVQYFESIEKRLIALYIDHNALYNFRKKEETKTCVYSLYNQLMMGYTKVYRDFITEESSQSQSIQSATTTTSPPTATSAFVIKISGVWETSNEIGITYKFIEMKTVE